MKRKTMTTGGRHSMLARGPRQGRAGALIAFVGVSAFATSLAADTRSEVSALEDERVCLSLRVLKAQVTKALAEKVPLPEACKNLAGIGYLEGFIVDEAADKDVILVGRVSKTRPALQLDDLIVNMRAAADSRRHPYCSLDPRPEDIQTWQRLAHENQALTSVEQIRAFIEKLKAAVGPQKVVVGGVPRDSRHAHAMIDADYHMKKASQGRINVPGVVSYLDCSLRAAVAGIDSGQPVAGGVSMARFWFHMASGSPTYLEAAGIVWLGNCSVVVLTEKQMATASGELYDVAQDDPCAKSFADDLSRAFTELARTVEPYGDLEHLFRLRALLLAMGIRGSLDVLGENFASYLSAYSPRDDRPMAEYLPGLSNSKERTELRVRGDDIYQYFLCPVVCGGVGMDFVVRRESFVDAKKGGRLFNLRMAALLARPSRDSLSWTITNLNLTP